MAQTKYATMFVWTVLDFFWTLTERKKKEHLAQLELSASPQLKMLLSETGRVAEGPEGRARLIYFENTISRCKLFL